MTRPTWDADDHEPSAKHDERGRSEGGATARDVIAHNPNPDRHGRWLSASIVVLGAVAIVQAAAFDIVAGLLWNALLVGAALIATGAYNYARRADAEFGSVGVAMLTSVLGLWLVASPFVIGPETGTVAAANELSATITVVVGLLVVGIGSYSAVTARARRGDADARATAVYDRRGQ
ncbi:uncharacterized protein Nmag_0307 [Natrialba magadii ATCC 43099]|uniref:SPW repeat-containing integral membrane domain-containing protein n=1 Tax=Natrialba magadii (strain ATCC 43099 / DSM 3394 / CCM 3739 / CIP 104546 / IAM 13178 / JCM 8861 / NBRC 102185 / NCIMB 2190 / MS3) TaxID=547559 RepID=D3SX78_NATMM|nr:hypothetical protein [Natrialba magadii]ADD03898.1 uncharacterized protein Nmag_0307 [Natrialba magadii ATCC 43099]ELY33558.1 hypothetical protein C500_01960 [Natrialba magadii ATCC 43099]